MQARLLVPSLFTVVVASTSCVGASDCLGPAFQAFSDAETGGAASPEDAASQYAATMRSPKAPTAGWSRDGHQNGDEAFVVNGDWRFRTVRLTDRTWTVASGERCDRE